MDPRVGATCSTIPNTFWIAGELPTTSVKLNLLSELLLKVLAFTLRPALFRNVERKDLPIKKRSLLIPLRNGRPPKIDWIAIFLVNCDVNAAERAVLHYARDYVLHLLAGSGGASFTNDCPTTSTRW